MSSARALWLGEECTSERPLLREPRLPPMLVLPWDKARVLSI